MSSIIDKVILITISSIALLSFVEATVAIYYIILIIGISSLLEVLKNSKKQIILLIVYCIASYFFPFIIIFIGVIIYDFLDKRYLFGLFIITILINLDKISLNFFNIIIVSIIVAIIEKIRTDNFTKKKNEFIYKRDSLTETAINLKNKIELILNKQDSDVQIATLNERNRIAREIHDTVGHLLTSSILQLGAIKTTVNDEKVSEGLNQLQETISEGMNSVRHSIHNLRDESIDIDAQLNKIISEFNFCDINFNNNIYSKLSIKAQYAVIAIVKEALSNVINHSNASKVDIRLVEHPKIFQLIINDNGENKPSKATNLVEKSYGMGLENIRQRVSSLNGYLGITSENGYQIFISFPKEDNE